MRGSIQRKGATYYAVIPLNGKRKWYRGGPTRKDAQRVLNEHLPEIDKGTYRELPKITFSEFTEIWKRDYADIALKPATKKNQYYVIKGRLLPAFSNIQLSSISTGLLQAFVSARAKEVKPNTVRNDLTVIQSLFKHAYRLGYIKHKPAEGLIKPKVEKPEIEILTPGEFELFLKEAEMSYKTAFLTAFLTGMRAGELWGLKWGDLDWNSKQIHVRRSLWEHQFQKPKTKNAIRRLDLTDRLVRELRAWKLACPVSEHSVVFPSPEGLLTMHGNVVKRYFEPALRRAGLRHVSFHSVRHSNASLRIHAGQNIKYIQGQLGHASITLTMDTYGHLFNDLDFSRKQVELLESVRNPLENIENLNIAVAVNQ